MEADHSSYIGIECATEELAWQVRKAYEQARPGKTFGHTTSREALTDFLAGRKTPVDTVIIERLDRDWFEELANTEGLHGRYVIRPVFPASELNPTEIATMRQACRYAVVDFCEVCNKPMLSGHHKHLLKFCELCGKKTVWSTPFFGYPFHCTEARHNH